MTHYRTLGVSRDAASDDVRRAYHRAARRAHPDVGGSDAQMQRLNVAYETLIDPAARAAYDRALARAQVDTAGRPRPDGPGTAAARERSGRARPRTAARGGSVRVEAGAFLRFGAIVAVVAVSAWLLRATQVASWGEIGWLPVLSYQPWAPSGGPLEVAIVAICAFVAGIVATPWLCHRGDETDWGRICALTVVCSVAAVGDVAVFFATQLAVTVVLAVATVAVVGVLLASFFDG